MVLPELSGLTLIRTAERTWNATAVLDADKVITPDGMLPNPSSTLLPRNAGDPKNLL